MSDTLVTRQRGAIFEIVLNREDKRNAMNWEMIDALSKAIDEAERLYTAGQARAVYILSEGRVFSSGIDLESFMVEHNRFGERWTSNLFPMTEALQNVFNRVEDCSLPVFCLLHGYCLGLGLELALACDFRIAAERTRIALPESRLGMIPDVGGTTRLTKLIGPSRAKEIIMRGDNVDLELAERWGLVNYIVPKEMLIAKADEIAGAIAQSAPMAVSYTKRVVNDILENGPDLKREAWAQAQLLRTQDFENGVKAMLTKTYPVEWQGK